MDTKTSANKTSSHPQGISFDDETYEILERESAKQDRSFSWLVRKAVREFWGKHKSKEQKQ